MGALQFAKVMGARVKTAASGLGLADRFLDAAVHGWPWRGSSRPALIPSIWRGLLTNSTRTPARVNASISPSAVRSERRPPQSRRLTRRQPKMILAAIVARG